MARRVVPSQPLLFEVRTYTAPDRSAHPDVCSLCTADIEVSLAPPELCLVSEVSGRLPPLDVLPQTSKTRPLPSLSVIAMSFKMARSHPLQGKRRFQATARSCRLA